MQTGIPRSSGQQPAKAQSPDEFGRYISTDTPSEQAGEGQQRNCPEVRMRLATFVDPQGK
jgi:hypothetical protein